MRCAAKGQVEKLIDPGVLALNEFRGRRLGLPWASGSIGMVGRLKVLQATSVAKRPASVDDFVDASAPHGTCGAAQAQSIARVFGASVAKDARCVFGEPGVIAQVHAMVEPDAD